MSNWRDPSDRDLGPQNTSNASNEIYNSPSKPKNNKLFDSLVVNVMRQFNNQSPEDNNSRSRNYLLGKLVILGVTIMSIGISIGIGVGINIVSWRTPNSDNNKIISESDAKKMCTEEGDKTLREIGLNPSQYKTGTLVYDSNIIAEHNAWKHMCSYARLPRPNQKAVSIEVGLDLDGFCVKTYNDPQLISEASDLNSEKFSFKCVKSH